MCARMRPTINECSVSKRPSSAARSAGIFLQWQNRPERRTGQRPRQGLPDRASRPLQGADLKGLEVDYLALAARLGRPPLRSDWIVE
jgi:hypothetical protein